MCTGAEFLVPLLFTAGGTAVSTIAQQRALRRQDEEAARGIMRQGEISRRAGEQVTENIEQLGASTPEAERAAALADFMNALRTSRASGPGPLASPVGATSERFAEDVGAARTAAGAESAATAGRLARIDAPTFQRLREGQQRADLASRLARLGSESSAQDFLTQLRIAGIQPNPFVTGIGQGLAAFGTAFAGRAKPTKFAKPGKTIIDTPPLPGGPFDARNA